MDAFAALGLGVAFDLAEDLEACTGDVAIGEPACIGKETKKPRTGAAMIMDHKKGLSSQPRSGADAETSRFPD